MHDTLGARIKEQYENRTRYMLPRRTYTILRLDGKAFHTYTRGLKRPFDGDLFEDMDKAIIAMLPELQGAVFAYTQSDEISVLLTDFAKPTTSAWFDGNLQKMVSVAASIMTANFNQARARRQVQLSIDNGWDLETSDVWPLAYFDCRAFTIPDRTEVMNYFRWRQQDCIRNSVSMVAQANFSHKELHGKSQSDMHEMLHTKGVNWATDYTNGEKNGRVIIKQTYIGEAIAFLPTDKQLARETESGIAVSPQVLYPPRTRWVSKGAWNFMSDEGALMATLPNYE